MLRLTFIASMLVFYAICIFPIGVYAIEGQIVILQALDKVTARVSTFRVDIGEIKQFGTLQIIPRACERTPPEEPPESVAYLEIIDIRPGSPSVDWFRGWMFASSPALNALEHPVYDVWVLECKRTVKVETEKGR